MTFNPRMIVGSWVVCLCLVSLVLEARAPAPDPPKKEAKNQAKASAKKRSKKLDPTKDALLFVVDAPGLQLSKGKAATGKLLLSVAKGFHVQSNPAKPRLIPTALKIEKNDKVDISGIQYPKGISYRLKGSARELSVYEGKFEIGFLAKATAKAKPGKFELTGKVRYQACNDITCFFPKSIPITIPVNLK